MVRRIRAILSFCYWEYRIKKDVLLNKKIMIRKLNEFDLIMKYNNCKKR